MTKSIKMPIHTFTPAIVQDLQEKYPAAIVQIELESSPEHPEMDEDRFWEIIALLDWGRKRNEDIIAPAIEALSSFSIEDIFRFEDILSAKLHMLDAEVYATALYGQDAGAGNFSVDGFLYARCCAVANGKRFYEKVLHGPGHMPRDCSFESLLYMAEQAYKVRTGADDYDYLPQTSYETFSNVTGWPGRPSLEERLNSGA